VSLSRPGIKGTSEHWLIFRTVATSQTLSREGRLEKYRPEDYGLIIVDEAHHAAAKS